MRRPSQNRKLRAENRHVSQTVSTARRSEPTTSSWSKPVISMLKNRSESVSPAGGESASGSSSDAFRIVPLWQ